MKLKTLICLALLLMVTVAGNSQTKAHWLQIKGTGDVREYAAKGDGRTDDTIAIQTAINNHANVTISSGTYRITTTLLIPSNRSINITGASILADNGSDPIFKLGVTAGNLTITQSGGTINGTASAFLETDGSSSTPTAMNQYSSNIHLNGLNIVGETTGTIGKFLDAFSTRQIFVSNCHTTTVNGILLTGKCVEIFCDNMFLYGQDAADSYGIRCTSADGGNHEGLIVTNSGFDRFLYNLDIKDIFQVSLSNSWIGGSTTAGYRSIRISPPTTASSTTQFLVIGNGCVIESPLEFVAGVRSYYSIISDSTFYGITGANIIMGNGASDISLSKLKFTGSTSGVVLSAASGNNYITVENCDTDASFVGGLQFNDAGGVLPGADPVIHGFTYRGTGEAVYNQYPAIISDLHATVSSSSQNLGWMSYVKIIPSTYAVASNTMIASLTVPMSPGQHGIIHARIEASGMDAATQLLKISIPANVVVPFGTAWSSQYYYPKTTTGGLDFSIPFYTTGLATGPFWLSNQAGNSVVITGGSYMAITLH